MNSTDRPDLHENATDYTSGAANRAMRLFGDVWTLMIVCTLMSGTRRFGELLETMGNVSPKTLSHRLKRLEEVGFVQRRAYAEIPPRVEYCLTGKGLELGEIIKSIRRFGEMYLQDIEDPPEGGCSPPTET